MSVSRLDGNQLRPAEHLLVWAFVLSIVAHLIIIGGFEAGQRFGWWKKDLLPAWLKHTQQSLAEIQKARQQQKQQQPVVPKEAPLLFVEVDPTQAAPEPPKNAKYYSSQNAVAANPDVKLDTETPKIDGQQTHVPKTMTAPPRTKAVPLQPSPPKNPEPEQAAEEAKPKPKGGQQIGDLAMAKPAPQPGPSDGQTATDTGQAAVAAPAHVRPRTLIEAEAQKALAGEKMKQDGGVSHIRLASSLDTIGTPTGEYDRQLIEAIQSHWWDLLTSKQFARDGTGAVVIEFRLNYDGRVTDLKVVDSNVSDLLTYVCQSAIHDPAPFAKWPSDMRRVVGADYRDIRFTFYYE
jgi:outer membrane biosynthesis protein TonB